MSFGGPSDRWRLLWLAIVFFTILIPAIDAAEPLIQIETHVGFGGYFHHQAWSPLLIEVTGNLPVDAHLEVSVPRNDLLSAAQTYVTVRVPFAVVPDHRHRFSMNIPLVSSPYPLAVRVTDRTGRVMASEEIPLRNAAIEGPIYLVLDPEGSGWTWLPPYLSGSDDPDPRQRPRVVHARRSDDLPAESQVYATLAAIIIKDTFPVQTLSRNQVDAISAYVRTGGHLILVGGSTPPDLPLLWRAWLDELTDRVTVLEISQDTWLPAWEAITDDGTPILEPLERQIGSGKITLFPFDPSSPMLDETVREDVAARLWTNPYDRLKTSFSDDEVWRLLGLTELAFDEDVPLTLALVLYAIVITGQMLLLRRVRWVGWLLTATIVLSTFFAWAFVEKSGLKDGVVYAEFQLTQGLQNGMALNRSYGLLVPFGPKAIEVAVESPKPAMFPAPHHSHVNVESLLIGDTSYYRFDLDTPPLALFRDQYDRFDVHVRLYEDTSILQIVNDTEADLRFTYLIDGQRLIPLGDIPARTIKEWTTPPEALPGLGWIGINLQTQLMRQSRGNKPDDFAIRFLALAADRGYEGALTQRPSFIVALIPAKPVATIAPAGRAKHWHVVIVPLEIVDTLGGNRHVLG